MIPLEDALNANARVSWQEAGHKGWRTGQRRALALRFTDLKLGATLVHVIGTANSRLGPFYSKVSLMAIKRRGLLLPMWQGMPATTLYFVDCER